MTGRRGKRGRVAKKSTSWCIPVVQELNKSIGSLEGLLGQPWALTRRRGKGGASKKSASPPALASPTSCRSGGNMLARSGPPSHRQPISEPGVDVLVGFGPWRDRASQEARDQVFLYVVIVNNIAVVAVDPFSEETYFSKETFFEKLQFSRRRTRR